MSTKVVTRLGLKLERAPIDELVFQFGGEVRSTTLSKQSLVELVKRSIPFRSVLLTRNERGVLKAFDAPPFRGSVGYTLSKLKSRRYLEGK